MIILRAFKALPPHTQLSLRFLRHFVSKKELASAILACYYDVCREEFLGQEKTVHDWRIPE